MNWEARTAFVEINTGTRLCIFEQRQIAGDPPGTLIGHQKLPIELGDGKWVSAVVREADGHKAVLELEDGRIFEMSVRKANEFDSAITIENMHTEDWVIRNELPN